MRVVVSPLLAAMIIAIGALVAVPESYGQSEVGEDATVVQKGQVTPDQIEYSKTYRNLYRYRLPAPKLTQMAEAANRRGNEKEIGVTLNVRTRPTIGNVPELSGEALLTSLACTADAVVVGTAIRKTSYLTDDETFIYTAYGFAVDEIVKNNRHGPISAEDVIEVTRPGGLIILDGQTVRVEDRAYEPLKIRGRYVLYLRYVPTAGGYIVASPEGDFEIGAASVRHLSKLGSPDGLKTISNVQEFLIRLRASADSRCQAGGG